MPALSRRAFLAGLMAVPAAACVPGIAAAQTYGASPAAQALADARSLLERQSALDEAFRREYHRMLWAAIKDARHD